MLLYYDWAETLFGENAEADCAQYNSIAFNGDTNVATRACAATGFAAVNTAACTKISATSVCPAVTVAADGYALAEGYEHETRNVACNGVTSSTVVYTASDEFAVAQCSGGTWSTAAELNVAACTTLAKCPVAMPWPATDIAPNYVADGTHATRTCGDTAGVATWGAADV